MSWTLAQLAEHVNAELKGDGNCAIHSVASLLNAEAGQISFLTNSKYKEALNKTRASAVIVHADDADGGSGNLLIVQNPHAAFARIAQLLHPVVIESSVIHPSAQIADTARVAPTVSIGANAVVDEGAEIAAGTYIGANAYVGKNARVGTDCRLLANTTVCDGVELGERVLLHPGSVIGADGFGQAYEAGRWVKVPQIGRVIIGDDVEIGANTTVDRGAIENTVIEDGVKLDNQIQVAHNVRIGANTVIAASTAIAGSTIIGRNCMIAGAVAIAGHLTITDNVTITGMTMVSKSITKPGSYSSGISAESTTVWHRLHARLKMLDELAKRLRNIEKKLKNT